MLLIFYSVYGYRSPNGTWRESIKDSWFVGGRTKRRQELLNYRATNQTTKARSRKRTKFPKNRRRLLAPDAEFIVSYKLSYFYLVINSICGLELHCWPFLLCVLFQFHCCTTFLECVHVSMVCDRTYRFLEQHLLRSAEMLWVLCDNEGNWLHCIELFVDLSWSSESVWVASFACLMLML